MMGGSDDSPRSSGLSYVLGATVIAGALGYLIQAVVPAFLPPQAYVVFGVTWSAIYLVVSALSGIQQEVTRASRPGDGSGWRVVRSYAAVVTLVAVIVVGLSAVVWAPTLFGSDAAVLGAAVVAAALGYTLVAVLSGALYGLRHWRGVAAMTVADAVLRVLAIAVALSVGAGIVLLGWAIALPFLLAVTLLWVLTGRRVRSEVVVDATLAGLLRHSAGTVVAAVAMGLLISGLPFLLGLTARAMSEPLLASLILVITLTRAPLIIPILALQSYLVVVFRDRSRLASRPLAMWGGGLVAATALLSVLALVIGPWVLALLYGDRYSLAPIAFAVIVLSAGLTGLMCVTGPAVLAASRHIVYVAGWVTAAGVLIGVLLLPIPDPDRVLWAITLAPLTGVAVHLLAALRPRTPATD